MIFKIEPSKRKVFDDVIVSTDDIEIKTISEQHGKFLSYVSELAEDQVGTVQLLNMQLNIYQKRKYYQILFVVYMFVRHLLQLMTY